MVMMGQYCKAYQLKEFRRFVGWRENEEVARLEEGEEQPRPLSDDDVVYLQENFVVTDGTFIDERIIFENATEKWKQFCREELKFSIPQDVLAVATVVDVSADVAPEVEESGGSETTAIS